MAEQARPIEDLVRTLGPEQQEAVRRFIETLASKSDNAPAPEPAFRWAGALRDWLEFRRPCETSRGSTACPVGALAAPQAP